jgi:transcriptional regulator with XRE-family HTH domain
VNGWERVIAVVIARRSELGLTQKELALRAGVAERTVQNLEGGKRPQPLIRGKIEKALGWPPGEMERIARTEPEPKSLVPQEVLEVLERVYKGEPEQLREAVRALEAIERERRQTDVSHGERRAG